MQNTCARRLMAMLMISAIPLSNLSAAAPSDLPFVRQSDFQYVGAFRTPQGTSGGSRFGYGGAATAYNGANDSLFLTGHVHTSQYVAEISIPAPVLASDVAQLPIATVLQPFADVTDGLLDVAEPDRIGGLLIDGSQLVWSAYEYYDADTSVFQSHGTSSLDLSLGTDATGLFQVGSQNAGLVAGYMAPVPAAWQSTLGATHVTGQANIPIATRTSDGPALFGFRPADLGAAIAPEVPLVAYPYPNSLVPIEQQNVPNEVYNRADEIAGVAFPEASRSVLFFGMHGMGAYCYGTGGTGSGADCLDPVHEAQGTHAYPYRYQVWAYDALDLAKVKQGETLPHEVQPYAVWELDLPFATEDRRLGAVSYDPVTNRLFVPQLDVSAFPGDLDTYPVIHVFSLAHSELQADLDFDGDVDGSDFLALQRTSPSLIPDWQSQFGSPGPGAPGGFASSQTVPEPASLTLALLSLGLFLGQRTRT